MIKASKTPATFQGARWRATHQSTVDSVLGPNQRRVYSRGSSFFNKDAWTARAFLAGLCKWAELNPGATPTRYDVEDWVRTANAVRCYDPSITIAATPDVLPKGEAMALVGGGYHEAWHTEMSRRTPLHMNEVWPRVLELWGRLPNDPAKGETGWAKLTGMLLTWDNIIDDIRIERRGCEKYPGARDKMEALQDLILRQENGGREAAGGGHRAIAPQNAMSLVIATFRDLGLGYQTPAQSTALKGYRKASESAFRFVDEGPLRPLLDRAVALSIKPDLEGMWLAMEAVVVIAQLAATPPPPPAPPSQGGEAQEGGGSSTQPDSEPQKGQKGSEDSKPQVFKVGDRATLQAGPHKGREVEITRAGLPHPETGVQDLAFSLVEPD